MKRLVLAIGVACVSLFAAAQAEETAASCSVADTNILSADQAEVTIRCAGMPEAYGKPFADILTRVLKDRLDPQTVIAKLDEVNRVPSEGAARLVSDEQAHAIIQSLSGKPVAQIVITAHPLVEDSVGFATAIANPLLRVGWQIAGQQIRRAAPKSLEAVSGVAIVVHDKEAPPPPALQLRAALTNARIGSVLLSDASVGPDTTLLWIGKRPTFAPTEQK